MRKILLWPFKISAFHKGPLKERLFNGSKPPAHVGAMLSGIKGRYFKSLSKQALSLFVPRVSVKGKAFKTLLKSLGFMPVFMFLSLSAFSAVVGSAKVQGIIVKYDKDTVTLSQRGQKTTVPRKAIPGFFKIQSGNEVYALFEGEDLMEQLQAEKKKREKAVKKTRKKKASQ